MKRCRAVWMFTAILFVPFLARGQELPNDENAPLVLVRIIPIPGVSGRFDHMAVDNNGGRVFAASYGNDSVEVIDTARGIRARSIKEGFIKPQMVSYLPDLNRIVVASEGDGTCKIFDADTYRLIDTVKYSDDADQLRYDPAAKRVYVGYGDEAESAIGIFDAATNKKVGEDFKLGAHPESFQLEEKGPRIFVNLASISQIAVIDRNTRKIEKWKLQSAGTNFPMALDEAHRRIFVAARKPARLLVLDMDSGKEIASLPGAIDTDDMSFDSDRKRIYVTSGEGFIFVYQQIDADRYQRIAKIPTTIGARTSAYTGQVGKHNSFYLAVPARADRGAELWVYETRD
ncbi:MAG TPA: YncE family protein [Candidatus Acidoferrales bacterium]|nr:YncE family protein [Candidatus Acidoferrales bacterium]